MKIDLKLILTICLILYGSFWYMLFIANYQQSTDSKLMLMDLKDLPKLNSIDIQKINDYRYDINSRYFEFGAVLFKEKPNILGNKAIFVIIPQKQIVESAVSRFLYQLQRQNEEANYTSTPIYYLKKKKNFFLDNEKQLDIIAEEINKFFTFCVLMQKVNKYSIFSYETGAILTLYALTRVGDTKIFDRIDKVVLINPFNPQIKIFQSNPKSLVNIIKNRILNDQELYKRFNECRLIIINCIRTFYVEESDSIHYFNFAFFDHNSNQYFKLQNTVSISTKNMWNVYITFRDQNYFLFEPFVWMINKFFFQDNKQILTSKEIIYFFAYRETAQAKLLSQHKIKRYSAKCKDIYLENIRYKGYSFQGECIRLIKKQYFYYENSTLLIYSNMRKFDVYGSQFQKIYPIESKIRDVIIYHIQNVNQISKLYIISGQVLLINVKIMPIHTPLYNPLQPTFFQSLNGTNSVSIKYKNIDSMIVIRSCEPSNLLFPIHYKQPQEGSGNILKRIQHLNCYFEEQKQQYTPEWFIYHWNFIFNMMIFNCFASHVLAEQTYKRFSTQMLINLLLLALFLKKFYQFEAIIITSVIALLQILLIKIAQMIKKFEFLKISETLLIAFPLVSELCSKFTSTSWIFTDTWKILTITMILTAKQDNILITILKYFFLIDSFQAQVQYYYGLVLIFAWQYFTSQQFKKIMSTGINRMKLNVANKFFLIILGICINEDGSVIHQIINFYIVTYCLLTIGSLFNDYFDKN